MHRRCSIVNNAQQCLVFWINAPDRKGIPANKEVLEQIQNEDVQLFLTAQREKTQ